MPINAFRTVILNDCWLDQAANYWIVLESNKNTNNKVVHIGGCPSIGFSLEKIARAFPFFASVKGVNSVADAMVVAQFQGEIYFGVMDMKSGNPAGATSQIESARLFLDWVLSIAKHNGYCAKENMLQGRFFGIVNLAPRGQVRKTTSRRAAEIPKPERSAFGDYPVFQLKNHPKVPLPEIIKRMGDM